MHAPLDPRVSYEVAGDGPLVVCVPGMADLRSTFRFTAPALIEAGYRVAIIDLRGHGDSATDFDRYDNPGNAEDVAALIDHLGGPAVIIGNSMGAAVGTLVAAERPDLVAGLVLVGPFVRNGKANALLRAVMRVATSAPLVGVTWKSYLPSLYRGTPPTDLPDYLAAVATGMKGHEKAISATMRTSHDVAEAALPRVTADTLVVMGELDPDFPSPAGEAAWIAEQLGAEVLMVPDAGHYPHSQRPDLVVPAVTAFLQKVTRRA
ncbi:alpha/beta fold hydrolase [Pseudolysinimonas yzui]|uniref:Hydrolase n=1 Tax=Pseudolysinimonas yzui TaxID=2708254 RepID=A0A8J3GS98_9MICO|nr:alpha/beta hydrolase [Pseudolysinimonas yzui]GHF21848.1 hydrolase [Pseudolysinimonas yzui]